MIDHPSMTADDMVAVTTEVADTTTDTTTVVLPTETTIITMAAGKCLPQFPVLSPCKTIPRFALPYLVLSFP
jgi:hypothetical protein